MLEQFYNPTAPKVYWWRSRAFRIGLAIFAALAVLAIVLFNQQISDLLKSFGTKAAINQTLTISGDPSGTDHQFLDGAYTTPAGSFTVRDGKLMLEIPAL